MSHLWLISVLSDLQRYAARNDLPALSKHLETAIQLAHLEIASKPPAPNKRTPPAPNRRDDDA